MAIYHVVSLKFKEGIAKEQLKGIEDGFLGLKPAIPEVQTLHWGTNVSQEGRDKGFTHCWLLTFADLAARDAYLVAPPHVAFTILVGPWIADVFVFDFEAA